MKRAEPTTSLQPSQISCLMTAVDVGLILGISTKTVNKLVREGKLSCVQVTSRDRRFTHEQVQEYIRSQTTCVRVDKKRPRPVSSRPKKGGDWTDRGEKTGVSKACLLQQLKEEMRQW
jgi:excisionase family DNA binding protein